MPGTLFVVATPIGNLEDITLRALRTLREVNLIAAEDTRRTAKLLSHHHIHCRMVSLHAHNEHREAPKLIAQLLAGASIALVTDAGTPGISDPGEFLVRLAHEGGLKVTPIPGASAVAAALSVSGLPASQFVFMGFPPRSGQERRRWLERLAADERTIVAFESPHRIIQTLKDVTSSLVNRQIQLHREITKLNEELVLSQINESEALFKALGEFVLVIGPKTDSGQLEPQDAAVATSREMVGCLTMYGDFELDEAVSLAAKALSLEPSAVRKAWKKHRILENRRRDGLS
jgi:16S rRNA (cytidine1402-2'-O)-methyltransferase